jgi:hypothetical protein
MTMAATSRSRARAGKAANKPQTGPRAAGKTAANSKAAKEAKEAQAARERAMNTKLNVDGESYRLGDLTLGELEELEDHTGLPMDVLRYSSAKVITFVVYLVRRRKDPDYSLDDARNIKIDAVGQMTQDDDGDLVVGDVGSEGRPT